MAELFLTSLETVALLLLMAIPGFIIAKVKLVDIKKAVEFISTMLLYVCQPFITFNSFLNNDFDKSIVVNLAVVFGVTIVLMLLLALVARGIFSFEKDRDRRGALSFAGSFGNLGFMCIPFLQMLSGNDSLVILYATSAVVAYNLLAWTVGNYLITGDRKNISLKRALLNPPTLSFFVALPLYIFNINFQRIEILSGVGNICGLFANMVGPLSMTMLGMKLAESNFKTFFLDYKIYVAAGIKLMLAPVLAFCILLILSTFMDVTAIALNVLALSAMPTANNVMMFSALAGKDTEYGARLVMVTTLLSIVTIPIALLLLGVIT